MALYMGHRLSTSVKDLAAACLVAQAGAQQNFPPEMVEGVGLSETPLRCSSHVLSMAARHGTHSSTICPRVAQRRAWTWGGRHVDAASGTRTTVQHSGIEPIFFVKFRDVKPFVLSG